MTVWAAEMGEEVKYQTQLLHSSPFGGEIEGDAES